MESADISELMDTVGVKTQIVKQGTYKEAGTPTRQWTDAERAELETLTKDTYELFVNDVATARGLDVSAAKSYADAHIFSAKRAKEAGLIDNIGVKNDAKSLLMQEANISKAVWKEKDKFDSFMDTLESKSILQIQNYFYGLKSTLF